MLIKQMSVFVENTTGRLGKLTGILADAGVDIIACTIAETTDFGILRCIVPDPQTATDLLKKNGFTASLSNVIAVSIEDKVGGFNHVLQYLSEAQVGVKYVYSTVKNAGGKAVIVMKPDDPEKAVGVLTTKGVQLVSIEDFMA
ncbi:MAG: acetolactate synthase [Eubacteriaceae bacterium]|nr:acetolactate synthase [Eubacteriaceae bacterium]